MINTAADGTLLRRARPGQARDRPLGLPRKLLLPTTVV